MNPSDPLSYHRRRPSSRCHQDMFTTSANSMQPIASLPTTTAFHHVVFMSADGTPSRPFHPNRHQYNHPYHQVVTISIAPLPSPKANSIFTGPIQLKSLSSRYRSPGTISRLSVFFHDLTSDRSPLPADPTLWSLRRGTFCSNWRSHSSIHTPPRPSLPLGRPRFFLMTDHLARLSS